jgi:hypothetical protein
LRGLWVKLRGPIPTAIGDILQSFEPSDKRLNMRHAYKLVYQYTFNYENPASQFAVDSTAIV